MKDIIDLIDGAIGDATSHDAMRWTPEPAAVEPLFAGHVYAIMDDICAWLTANGITPGGVPISEVPTIAAGQITIAVMLRRDGRVYIDADERIATATVTVPMVVEPPAVLEPWIAGRLAS